MTKFSEISSFNAKLAEQPFCIAPFTPSIEILKAGLAVKDVYYHGDYALDYIADDPEIADIPDDWLSLFGREVSIALGVNYDIWRAVINGVRSLCANSSDSAVKLVHKDYYAPQLAIPVGGWPVMEKDCTPEIKNFAKYQRLEFSKEEWLHFQTSSLSRLSFGQFVTVPRVLNSNILGQFRHTTMCFAGGLTVDEIFSSEKMPYIPSLMRCSPYDDDERYFILVSRIWRAMCDYAGKQSSFEPFRKTKQMHRNIAQSALISIFQTRFFDDVTSKPKSEFRRSFLNGDLTLIFKDDSVHMLAEFHSGDIFSISHFDFENSSHLNILYTVKQRLEKYNECKSF